MIKPPALPQDSAPTTPLHYVPKVVSGGTPVIQKGILPVKTRPSGTPPSSSPGSSDHDRKGGKWTIPPPRSPHRPPPESPKGSLPPSLRGSTRSSPLLREQVLPPQFQFVDSEWQMNNKINPSSLPEWDGRGDSLLKYLSEINSYATMSEKMNKGVGLFAPMGWKGRAREWWDALPSKDRTFYSQDWNHLLLAVRKHFMNEHWVHKRTKEFEEMHFRQRGHYYISYNIIFI